MTKKIEGNKWAVTATLVILATLFLTRGGLASLGPLLRLGLPVIVVFIGYRMVKKQLRSAVDDAMKRQQDLMRGGPPPPGQSYQQRPGAGEPQPGVIDLCPKCGAYMQKNHRCKS